MTVKGKQNLSTINPYLNIINDAKDSLRTMIEGDQALSENERKVLSDLVVSRLSKLKTDLTVKLMKPETGSKPASRQRPTAL